MGNLDELKSPPHAGSETARIGGGGAQLEIAAIDHREAALNEANDGVSQGRCFPGLGGDARAPVNRDGDVTVRRAG